LRNFGEQSPLFSKEFPKKNAKLISQTRATPNLIEKCSSRVERKRRSSLEGAADEREAGKHIGPHQRAQPGHERALVVTHHHRGATIAERGDERNLVAQQI
jgi:hypothetical protein